MRKPRTVNTARRLLGAAILSCLAAPTWAQNAPCANPEGLLSDYLFALSTRLNLDPAATEAAKATTELTSRATSDGLANGRLDLFRRAFVALDLGEMQEEEGKLVFNFNPDALHLDSFGQFSPRIVVHQPAIYDGLEKKIDTLDEEVRADHREEIEKGLGDLDDVEMTLRWTPKSQEPAPDLQQLASTIFGDVGDDAAKLQATLVNDIAEAKDRISKVLGQEDPLLLELSLAKVCENPVTALEVGKLAKLLATETPAINKKLDEALENAGYFRLADLIEGQPRFVFNGTVRQREGATGPDETKVDITWQGGWISYWGAKRFAKARNLDDLDADTVDAYFDQYGRLDGALPLFSLVAEYASTSDFRVAIPGVPEEFSQEGDSKWSAKATLGGYFGGGRDRRLELAAKYDFDGYADQPKDRVVVELSWVEHLGEAVAQAVGGSEVVVTAIWANKPEFRGEVDEDWGLRAGLKWSLGKPAPTTP